MAFSKYANFTLGGGGGGEEKEASSSQGPQNTQLLPNVKPVPLYSLVIDSLHIHSHYVFTIDTFFTHIIHFYPGNILFCKFFTVESSFGVCFQLLLFYFHGLLRKHNKFKVLLDQENLKTLGF